MHVNTGRNLVYLYWNIHLTIIFWLFNHSQLDNAARETFS